MREKLFRGKSIIDGEWIYGNFANVEGKSCIIEELEISNDYGDGTDLYAVSWYEVIPESVGQYTGLKDKSGKEIYEGDICNFYGRFGIDKGVIEFLRYGFHIVLDNGSGFKIDEFHLDVIGNIYETHELLEGELNA